LGALAGGLQDIRDWAKKKKQEALLSG